MTFIFGAKNVLVIYNAKNESFLFDPKTAFHVTLSRGDSNHELRFSGYVLQPVVLHISLFNLVYTLYWTNSSKQDKYVLLETHSSKDKIHTVFLTVSS